MKAWVMLRKIFKTGHSSAVTLSKKIMDELELKVGDMVLVEMSGDKRKIIISKAKKDAQLSFGFKIKHKLGETRPGKN